jgi:hypothetical protein
MADPRAVNPPFKINTKMARSGVDQSNIVDGRRTRSGGSGKKNYPSAAFDAIILPNSPALSLPFIPMNGIPWRLTAAWQSVHGDSSSPRGAAATLGTVGETGTAFQVDAIEDARTGLPVGETGTADALVADKDLARTGGPVGEKGVADALVADNDNRVEPQGKGRKGRDRKRTPKDQRKNFGRDGDGRCSTRCRRRGS